MHVYMYTGMCKLQVHACAFERLLLSVQVRACISVIRKEEFNCSSAFCVCTSARLHVCTRIPMRACACVRVCVRVCVCVCPRMSTLVREHCFVATGRDFHLHLILTLAFITITHLNDGHHCCPYLTQRGGGIFHLA